MGGWRGIDIARHQLLQQRSIALAAWVDTGRDRRRQRPTGMPAVRAAAPHHLYAQGPAVHTAAVAESLVTRSVVRRHCSNGRPALQPWDNPQSAGEAPIPKALPRALARYGGGDGVIMMMFTVVVIVVVTVVVMVVVIVVVRVMS